MTEVCEEEWTDVSGELYFRTQTAQYLQDEKRLLVFMLCAHNFSYHFNFQFNLEISDENSFQSINLTNIEFIKILQTEITDDWILSSSFVMENILGHNNRSKNYNLTMTTFVYRNNTFYGKSEPLKVEIKNWISNSKDIFICTKALYMYESDYKNFEWWIEMNVKNGFNKIIVVNNSIPNNKLFNDLFKKYENQVDVIQFKKLPNVFNKTNGIKYYTHFQELIVSEDKSKKFAAEYISFNECVYKYSDQAEFIFVIDFDETFIPVKHEKLTNEDDSFQLMAKYSFNEQKSFALFENEMLRKSVCKEKVKKNMFNQYSYLKNYIDEIFRANHIPADYTVYFPQVLFLNNRVTEEIFSSIETTLKQYENTAVNLIQFPIKVKKKFVLILSTIIKDAK
jgi:hypothetical protein